MKCKTPIIKKYKLEDEFTMLTFPCGKCSICKKESLNEWYVRLLAELGDKKTAKFITLTYNDNNMPLDLSLKMKHIQLYIMRLRKYSENNIKYFYCGEYGEKTKRPHYHMILFGDISDKIIKENWVYGFTHIGSVNSKSIRYVLNYTQKENQGYSKYREILGEIKPPFQKMSKGLGLNYMIKNEKQIADNGCIIIQGYKYKIPRYYIKKSELIKDSVTRNSNDYFKSKCNQVIDKDKIDLYIRNQFLMTKQEELNITTRKNLSKLKRTI